MLRLDDKSKYEKEMNSKELITSAEGKLQLFIQRFKIIHQRTLRHELFSPSMLSQGNMTSSGKKKFQVSSHAPINYFHWTFIIFHIYEYSLNQLNFFWVIYQAVRKQLFLEWFHSSKRYSD